MEGFGKHLKELRLAAKITQSGLAEKLNLHPQTVSKWERGLSEPDIAQLGDLAAALGITLERLLGKEEVERSYTGNFQAEAFGKMLSELRAGRGESQEELAAVMSASPDAISRWERGISCPDLERLSALADHLRYPHPNYTAGIPNLRRRKALRLSESGNGFPLSGLPQPQRFSSSPSYYCLPFG